MILHSSQIILTALFLIWAFVVIKRINHIIDIKYRHLKNPKARVNHKYPGLARDDYTNWSRFEMAFCGIFLFPVRVTLFFGSLIAFNAFLKILVFTFRIKDLEEEQPKGFVKLSRFFIRIQSRFMLLCAGFHNIRVTKIQFNAEKYPELKCSKNTEPIVIISNHVGIYDGIYFLSTTDRPGFIARRQIADDIFVGTSARILQTLFVDRHSSKSRFDILAKLKERVSRVKNGEKLGKIVVFPEGATTIGNHILTFKKGPFAVDAPLKVVGFKYTSRFRPSNFLIDDIDSVLLSLLQFRNDLEVIEIDGAIEPNGKMEWDKFADNVREMMSEEFDIKKSDGDYFIRMATEKEIAPHLIKPI
jgi:lysophosphatidylcholine acyltransferase/lyso-PAF acetyltransferase